MGIRQKLSDLGVAPRKSLGQNFLVDPSIAQAIASAARIQPGDLVIEVGPGLGMLTRQLIAHAGRVIAIELDAALLPIIQSELGSPPNLTLVHADALDIDFARLACEASGLPLPDLPPARFVSNLPYYITSAVIRRMLESELQARMFVLTMQKEVAERIIAEPGEMSLLSVSVQFYGRPEIVLRLSPAAFYPQPDVDSAVVRIIPHSDPPQVNVQAFFSVARAGFSQRRKQLRNTLSAGLGITKFEADRLLLASQIDPTRRAETLTLPEWIALAQRHHITVDPSRS